MNRLLVRCMRSFALTLGLALATASAVQAEPDLEAQSRALQRASNAVVGVQALAVEDARTSAALGRARRGSGVVISAEGLVLTIGYLLLEAEQVEMVLDDGRTVPAQVVGYDVATGFGLLQALAPLKLAPVPLGTADGVRPDEPLVVVTGGVGGTVGQAQMLTRRPYSGYWEYHLDTALFTAPPHAEHSGAALFNLRGELLGIGSLMVSDALGPEGGPVPGNMFVPIDVLKPILREVRERGSSQASARAWIGVYCNDRGGQILVTRVSEDSPADVAGLQPGDRILRIDGSEVTRLEQLWKRLWAGSSPERAVALDIERDGVAQSLTLQSVDRAKTLRRAQGI